FSLGAYASDLDVARLLDRDFDQIADDGVDVAPHVADLGEFGGLDLDERGIGQLGQAAGNFCLAHAGGPDHQDVLGDDFVAQGLGHLLAAPTVAQRNGYGAFGAVLPDNVLVEFRDDFAGGHIGSGHNGWCLKCFDDVVLVCVNTQVTCDFKGLLDDFGRGDVGVLQ